MNDFDLLDYSYFMQSLSRPYRDPFRNGKTRSDRSTAAAIKKAKARERRAKMKKHQKRMKGKR